MSKPKSNTTLQKEVTALTTRVDRLIDALGIDRETEQPETSAPDPEQSENPDPEQSKNRSAERGLPLYRIIWNALFRPQLSNRRATLDISDCITFAGMDRGNEAPATIWRRDGRGKGPAMVCTRHRNGDNEYTPFDMFTDPVIPPTSDTPAQYYATVRQPNVLKVISPGTSGWQKIQAGMYIGVLIVLAIAVFIIIVILLGGTNQ